jgi:hypothetical protein
VVWRTATGEEAAELPKRSGLNQTAQPSSGAPEVNGAPASPAGPQRRPDAQRRPTVPERKRVGPIGAAVRKAWIVFVILAVIAVSGFCVLRLRSFFGDHDTRGIGDSSLDDIKPFNPKHVVYRVFGSGTTANINYLDINAQPRRIDNVPLPWTLSVTTTLPSVSVNVVAQTDGDQIGCQIIVNDVVKDERSITGVNAETFCIVKSA